MKRLALAAVLVACKRPAPSVTVDASVATPVEAAAPVATAVVEVDAAPAPRTLTYQVSLVRFAKDVLDDCTDFDLVVTPPADAGADWQPKEDVVGALAKSSKGFTKIAKRCEEQFSDRTALAACKNSFDRTDKKTGSSWKVRATTHHFNFGTVGVSDSDMTLCLKDGGDWTSIPRDSKEWRQAKLDHSRRGLQHAVDKLNAPADEP